MTSVNELPSLWRDMGNGKAENAEQYHGFMHACDDVERVARTAWKPISKQPHAEDGDSEGFVLIWLAGVGLGMTHVNKMDRLPPEALWARIRDVVLLPEGES